MSQDASSRFRFALAEPGDAPAVRELTRAAYAKWVPVIGREPKPMTADYQKAIREHRIELLYADDRLAGILETVDEGDTLLVENVAVSPALQGQGLGTRLMLKAEELARSVGCIRLRLYTNSRFEENIQLYRRLGYDVDAEVDIGAGTIRVDMSKAVAEPT
jgi:GNAT superfamily N-acetyltransferase